MSSYIDSTPKQFNKYTPTIDSQVYAQELGRNDTDYEQGVQRVNTALASVAGLPVASEDEQRYLQGKVSTTASAINRLVGTDYSDAKVSNTLAQQASAIYSDPNVQQAVANASEAKRKFTDMQDDTERTKGQNIANSDLLNKQYNSWRSGRTVGTKLDLNYSNYTDTDKWLQTEMAQKHPDQKINIERGYMTDANGKYILDEQGRPLLDISKYDAATDTWKGLNADEVSQELTEMIGANPVIANQLNINAQYKYRDYHAPEYYREHYNLTQRQIDGNQQNIDKYNTAFLNAKQGSPDATYYTSKLQELAANDVRLKNYRDQGLLQDTYNFGTNPTYAKSLLNDLYTKDFIHAQSRFYAYGEESVVFNGDGPMKNRFEQIRINQANRKLYDDETKQNFEMDMQKRQWEVEAELKKAQTKKALSEAGGVNGTLPVDIQVNTDVNKDAYGQLNKDVVSIDDAEAKSRNRFMLGAVPGNDSMFHIENGEPVPDSSKVGLLKSQYDNLMLKAANGDTTLDKTTIDHYNQTKEPAVVKELTQLKLMGIDKATKQHIQNDAESITQQKKLDNYFAPYKDTRFGSSGRVYTSQELHDFYNNFVSTKSSMSGEESAKYVDHYKYTDTDITTLFDHFKNFDDEVLDFKSSIDKYKSDLAKPSNAYTRQFTRSLLTGDPKHDKKTRDDVIAIGKARGIDPKVLQDNVDNYGIVGTRDINSEDYQVHIQPPGKEDIVLTVKPAEAKSLGIPIQDIPADLRRVSLNDPYGYGGNSGVPSLGGYNYNSGFDAVTLKNKQGETISYRYGLKRASNSNFYTDIFRKNLTTGQVLSPIQLEGKPTYEDAASTRDNYLKSFSTPASYDKTIDNNTNRNSQ